VGHGMPRNDTECPERTNWRKLATRLCGAAQAPDHEREAFMTTHLSTSRPLIAANVVALACSARRRDRRSAVACREHHDGRRPKRLSEARNPWIKQPAPDRQDGRGGNRTQVRGRTGQSLYELRLRLAVARRPVRSRPTDGLAIL